MESTSCTSASIVYASPSTRPRREHHGAGGAVVAQVVGLVDRRARREVDGDRVPDARHPDVRVVHDLEGHVVALDRGDEVRRRQVAADESEGARTGGARLGAGHVPQLAGERVQRREPDHVALLQAVHGEHHLVGDLLRVVPEPGERARVVERVERWLDLLAEHEAVVARRRHSEAGRAAEGDRARNDDGGAGELARAEPPGGSRPRCRPPTGRRQPSQTSASAAKTIPRTSAWNGSSVPISTPAMYSATGPIRAMAKRQAALGRVASHRTARVVATSATSQADAYGTTAMYAGAPTGVASVTMSAQP